MFGNAAIFGQASARPVSLIDQAMDDGTNTSFGAASLSGLSYAEGDTFIVAAVAGNSQTPVIDGSGWSTIGSESYFRVWQRTLGSSDDPNSYKVTSGGSTSNRIVIAGWVLRDCATVTVETQRPFGTNPGWTFDDHSVTTDPHVLLACAARDNTSTLMDSFTPAAVNDMSDTGFGQCSMRAGSDTLTGGTATPDVYMSGKGTNIYITGAKIICEGT